jgi:6-phosphogluconolactonase
LKPEGSLVVEKPELIVVDSADELAVAAADIIHRAAHQSAHERGRFTLALAGGSTPENTYAEMARRDAARGVDWSTTYLFFGDERYVPADDPRSNYHMALESLIGTAPIDEDHVFPIPTSLATSQACARMYAGMLNQFFGTSAGEMPCFDLVLLGLGDDGHTASLFPGAKALAVRKTAVTSTPPGTLPPAVERITLTYPAINAARRVLFLVAGESKAEALGEIWRGRAARRRRPAAGVRPKHGTLTWLVDRTAAANIAT